MIIYHAGIVLNWNNYFLVGLRNYKSICKKGWQFPQGRIEENENPLAAAKRELLEETSINPKILTWYDKETPWLDYKSQYNQHKIKFFYACSLYKPRVIICPKEFLDYKWETLSGLGKLFKDSCKSQVFNQALSML